MTSTPNVATDPSQGFTPAMKKFQQDLRDAKESIQKSMENYKTADRSSEHGVTKAGEPTILFDQPGEIREASHRFDQHGRRHAGYHHRLRWINLRPSQAGIKRHDDKPAIQ
jgi:hypothetical protein